MRRLSVIRRLAPAVLSVALGVGGLSLTSLPRAQAAPWTGTIDTTSITAVRNAYINILLPAEQQVSGWTGSISPCNPGTISPAAHDATVTAVNFFRAMDGLNMVSENTSASGTAQQAALMMAANNNLSHSPPTSWTCYTAAGATAAGQSNLSLGVSTGGAAVASFVDDSFNMTPGVGHRSWILYPPQSQVGVGIAGSAYPVGMALQLWGVAGMQSNARPSVPGAAWPSKNYFPYELLPGTMWSYAEPGANFSAQQVSVTKNGSSVSISGVTYVTGYGDPTVYWTMPALTRPAAGTTDTYHVTITGITGGSTSTVSYNVIVFNALETTIGSATISATPRVGAGAVPVTTTGVTPTGATLSYQWNIAGTPVSGATGSTYTPKPADAGKLLTVIVTVKYSDTSGTWTPSTVTSSGVTVQYGILTTAKPVITGTPAVGSQLTANPGTWSPAGTNLAYQWYANGAAVGTNSPTYTPTASDVGKTITVTVTGSQTGYQTASQASDATLAVALGTLTSPVPTIAGLASPGQTLTGNPGNWGPPGVQLSYQWYVDGVPVPGATGTSYTVTAAVGQTVAFTVAGSLNGYNSISRTASIVVVQNGIPMYRIYSPLTGEHFYTSSAKEASVNVNSGAWIYEGVGWYAPTSGVPVYRLAAIPGSGAAGHLFTTSVKERDTALASRNPAGQPYWKCETGVGMPDCVGWYSGGSVPLLRAFNPMPGPGQGQHNYTTDTNEQSVITGTGPLGGWLNEGVAWYGVQKGNSVVSLPLV